MMKKGREGKGKEGGGERRRKKEEKEGERGKKSCYSWGS